MARDIDSVDNPDVCNELTASILGKYGLGLENSATLSASRMKSEEVLTLSSTPALLRSKSFDPKALAPKISLKSWIDKFSTSAANSDKPETSAGVPSQGSLEVANESKFPVQSHEKSSSKVVSVNRGSPEDKNAPDSDDPFSDDDSFLANIKIEDVKPSMGSSNLSVPRPTDLETPSNLETGARGEIFVPESDPFSDDLDIGAIDAQTNGKIEKAELLPPQNPQYTRGIGAKISFQRPDFARYQIKAVLHNTYRHQNFQRKQLVLTVEDPEALEKRLVIRGDSAELALQAGDIIHLILTNPESPHIVDTDNNLLIWHPDVLVSSTVVADQLFCPRKTVLTRRLTFPGELSIPMLVGTMVHEIFQACFLNEQWDLEFMDFTLDSEIANRQYEIYTIGDVENDIREKIRSHFEYIQSWFKSFYRRPPRDIPTSRHNQKIKFSVADALDIEESVWSPMFGIKGIADVTLRARLEGDLSAGEFLLPMEIKTSREHLSHQAQAALYSLLFKDRYNADISAYLLVYTGEKITRKHDISVPDLKALINLRNRISVFLQSGRLDLPDLMRQQQCDRCQVQQSCMTVNYLTENGTAEGSGLNDGVYANLVKHLNGRESYKAFYNRWISLISSEEAFAARSNRDLWVLTAKERETKQGKALAGLVIGKGYNEESEGEHLYVFRRQGKGPHAPMTSSQLSKYDRVIVSDENGHFALCLGYVKFIDSGSITIVTRRRIISTELKSDKFHQAGVLRPSQLPASQGKALVFRIDLDEFAYGMGVARFNILNLFLADGDAKNCKLIVDLEKPKFLSRPTLDCAIPGLNEDQANAVSKVCSAEDYALILGMPGTGKTTVIAHLIARLALAGKTVLLTSYTNSAVDNILIKAKQLGVLFLRVGKYSRVHPDIREHLPGALANPINSYDEFCANVMETKVVAATCLSIRDATFNVRERFDYCIVDEASQVSMPLSLGPLALSERFVLVGDHYQLPPLVTHPDAKVKEGLSQSLFEILANAHPSSVSELRYQYRMSEDIMAISNELVYENRLKCGTSEVAQQKLELVNPGMKKADGSTGWLESVFEPCNRVLFMNHDNLAAYERVQGENVTNACEASLVQQTVEALCRSGVKESEIGVMTLYRSQLKLLMEKLAHRKQVEVLTADRFQGRDKACIIISMVRSNPERRVGELLKDWRRINVAVTRARSKLVVFGSETTLASSKSMKGFLKLVEDRGWLYKLPASAIDDYDFQIEEAASQKRGKVVRVGDKLIAKHPVVRNILQDMDINLQTVDASTTHSK